MRSPGARARSTLTPGLWLPSLGARLPLLLSRPPPPFTLSRLALHPPFFLCAPHPEHLPSGGLLSAGSISLRARLWRGACALLSSLWRRRPGSRALRAARLIPAAPCAPARAACPGRAPPAWCWLPSAPRGFSWTTFYASRTAGWWEPYPGCEAMGVERAPRLQEREAVAVLCWRPALLRAALRERPASHSLPFRRAACVRPHLSFCSHGCTHAQAAGRQHAPSRGGNMACSLVTLGCSSVSPLGPQRSPLLLRTYQCI